MYYVMISTGIGGGFIWNGNIIRFNGFAGEVGSVWGGTEEEASFPVSGPGQRRGVFRRRRILEKSTGADQL